MSWSEAAGASPSAQFSKLISSSMTSMDAKNGGVNDNCSCRKRSVLQYVCSEVFVFLTPQGRQILSQDERISTAAFLHILGPGRKNEQRAPTDHPIHLFALNIRHNDILKKGQSHQI